MIGLRTIPIDLVLAPVGEIAAAMELRSLHYFVRIAELGSITRASAHLQIAQPALTRHIQRLEDELDAALFTRANRGVRLTEAGQKLLESAQRILRDVERAGDEIRAHKAHPSGKIILGVTPPLCPVVVPELFARMREHYPLIELKVVHAGTARLEEFIVAGLVDLALMAEISRSRLIASTRLAEEEMVLVTRPGARPRGLCRRRGIEPHPADPRRRDARCARCAAGRPRHRIAGRHRTQRPRDDPADGAARGRCLDPAALLGLSRMRARAGRSAPHHRRRAYSAPWRSAIAASRGPSAARQAVSRDRHRGARPTSRPTASCARRLPNRRR